MHDKEHFYVFRYNKQIKKLNFEKFSTLILNLFIQNQLKKTVIYLTKSNLNLSVEMKAYTI